MLSLKLVKENRGLKNTFVTAGVRHLTQLGDKGLDVPISLKCGLFKRDETTGELKPFTPRKEWGRFYHAHISVLVDIEFPGARVFFGGMYLNKNKNYSVTMVAMLGNSPVRIIINNVLGSGNQTMSIIEPIDFDNYAKNFLSYSLEMVLRNYQRVRFARVAGNPTPSTAMLEEDFNNPYFVSVDTLLGFDVILKDGDSYNFVPERVNRVLEFNESLLKARKEQ